MLAQRGELGDRNREKGGRRIEEREEGKKGRRGSVEDGRGAKGGRRERGRAEKGGGEGRRRRERGAKGKEKGE